MRRLKRLHWWVFVALLDNLPDDTRMMKVAHIRTCPVPAPTKYNKEQRAALLRAKAAVALKPDITPQQSADALGAAILKLIRG